MVFRFLAFWSAFVGLGVAAVGSEETTIFYPSAEDTKSKNVLDIPAESSSNSSPNGSFQEDYKHEYKGRELSSESLTGSFGDGRETSAPSPEQLAFEEVLSGKRPLFPETSFESEYGKLTINSVSLDEESRAKLRETEFMKGSLENAFKADLDKKWSDACSTLSNVYDYVGSEWKSLPLSFSEALDSFYRASCLCLFESGIPSPEDPASSYNPCYAFSAETTKISKAISFIFEVDGENKNVCNDKNISDVLFQTTGVYLYALGRFLQGRRNPEKFGLVYRIAATHLCERLPDKYYISWALRSAYGDKETRELVVQEEPEPCLF